MAGDNSGDSHAYAADLDRHLRETNRTAAAAIEPAADQHGAAGVQRSQLGDNGHIREGRIQVVMPGLNWYSVSIAGGDGMLPCCRLLGDVGTTVFGCHDASALQVDNRVLVYVPARTFWGIILGVVPEQVDDGNFNFPDWVSQGSNVGVCRDEHHYAFMELTGDEGAVRDFSNHRPFDETSLDWGRMTDTGGGIHLDSEMAYLRTDEMSGLWCFYADQRTVLAGHILQIYSACHTAEYREDEGENTYFLGETPYPWEMLGAFDPGTAVHRSIDDTQVLYTSPYAKYEPKDDDQQPIHRYVEYGGYLGQARIRQVAAPPENATGTNRYQSTAPQQGLFREQISLDGEYSLQTAKGFSFIKRCLIPIPKQIQPPDSYKIGTDGCDSRENNNYKFAGQYGTGSAHKVGDFAYEEGAEHKGLLRASSTLNYQAYLANWKALHPFYYHKKDYNLPDESALPLEKNQATIPFDNLVNDSYLTPPDAQTVKVDHRYGEVQYYQTYSHVSALEDGTVITQGGLGEMIQLVGGNILIDAPGDIIVRPGRSFVVLAGDDVNVRARHSIDITASLRDVRVKAERNMMFLSSNGSENGYEDGCMLFESRSKSKVHEYSAKGGEQVVGSGIIFKAKHAQVAAMAAEIYLRTGNTDGDIDNGPIVLDASRGEKGGVIRVVADSINRFISNKAIDGFGRPTFTTVNSFSASETLLGGQLGVANRLVVNDRAIIRRGVYTPEGEFYSSAGNPVSKDPERGANISIAELVNSRVGTGKSELQSDYGSGVSGAYHKGDSAIGSSRNQARISFGLRNEDQYNTKNFVMTEAHWQRLAEIAGSGVAWSEPVVKYQGKTDTMPWPGKDKWSVDESYLTLGSDQLELYDLETGAAVSRFDSDANEVPYETPEYKKFVKKVPSTAYRVISCP